MMMHPNLNRLKVVDLDLWIEVQMRMAWNFQAQRQHLPVNRIISWEALLHCIQSLSHYHHPSYFHLSVVFLSWRKWKKNSLYMNIHIWFIMQMILKRYVKQVETRNSFFRLIAYCTQEYLPFYSICWTMNNYDERKRLW